MSSKEKKVNPREGKLLWAWVDKPIQNLVRRLAKLKGISVSEYLRQLILSDLDQRTVITSQFKRELNLEQDNRAEYVSVEVRT